eukprot:TRINITY_DN93203_c0_g1_i1.p1 TRINITY_DN93203_c0_g1~~TRINITY_DN93203_c0_g1_i1.p1  ORF type:complete len:514 (+),score=53.24 TRINITY_DN93203_c0_g1_i1:1024-2565(+)
MEQARQRHFNDITNLQKPNKRQSRNDFVSGWSKVVQLHYLWQPLGDWVVEISPEHLVLSEILSKAHDWRIHFIKDFSDAWKRGEKYEARLRPMGAIDCVGQHLFLSTPSLHSCLVIEGKGFLWLNKLPEESFLRCNWLEDTGASLRILPPLNLCFDLDETLIFNAPVRGASAPLQFVVKDPPHLLVEDVDPNGEISSSDSPFLRPNVQEFLALVCPFFRNVRVATFSVDARAKEVVEHIDKDCLHLRKNYKPDPLTGQRPVARAVFGRESLLQQGECLSLAERNHIKAGAVFWMKSLEMLDLPQKGLLQRSIVLDDRTDVWSFANQDNVVKISGPDRPENIGNPTFINGVDGGEIGKRMLLTLINLELKVTRSAAFIPNLNAQPILAPVRIRAPVPTTALAISVDMGKENMKPQRPNVQAQVEADGRDSKGTALRSASNPNYKIPRHALREKDPEHNKSSENVPRHRERTALAARPATRPESAWEGSEQRPFAPVAIPREWSGFRQPMHVRVG